MVDCAQFWYLTQLGRVCPVVLGIMVLALSPSSGPGSPLTMSACASKDTWWLGRGMHHHNTRSDAPVLRTLALCISLVLRSPMAALPHIWSSLSRRPSSLAPSGLGFLARLVCSDTWCSRIPVPRPFPFPHSDSAMRRLDHTVGTTRMSYLVVGSALVALSSAPRFQGSPSGPFLAVVRWYLPFGVGCCPHA